MKNLVANPSDINCEGDHTYPFCQNEVTMTSTKTSFPLVHYALKLIPQTLPPPYCHKERIKMNFYNGSIEIPSKKAGYVVSCGCGSGKTTNIRQFIVSHQKEGVLYCVDTKDELDKMEHNLKIRGIKEEDMLKIHGEIDKDVMARYQRQPDLVVNVPILLITHARLFVDMINLFLLYRPETAFQGFDGDFESLMSRKDIRKWIFLDETPLMFRPFIQFRHSLLGYFERGSAIKNYNRYIKGTKEDPFKNTTKLTEWKRDLVFNIMPKYLPKWKSLDKGKELEINFYTADLIQESMNTHVIVFEGAGDILLRTSGLFTLLDIKQKYNTDVIFEEIPDLILNRREPKPNLDIVCKRLADIINSYSGKVLVVVWKNIGKEKDNEQSGESEFRDSIRNQLVSSGCMPEKFEVTYFGASNTKSTNEFRDYSGMILLGNWSVANDKAKQINEAYMSATSPADQKLWYFVQLICRTAIRNHSGGEVRVWYTSDYSDKFIRRLDTYLNNNILTDNENLTGTWIDKMSEHKIQKNIQQQIIELDRFDPEISSSILTGRTYITTFSLDKLFELFPKSKKLKRDYQPLVTNLAKVGISLVIK